MFVHILRIYLNTGFYQNLKIKNALYRKIDQITQQLFSWYELLKRNIIYIDIYIYIGNIPIIFGFVINYCCILLQ